MLFIIKNYLKHNYRKIPQLGKTITNQLNFLFLFSFRGQGFVFCVENFQASRKVTKLVGAPVSDRSSFKTGIANGVSLSFSFTPFQMNTDWMKGTANSESFQHWQLRERTLVTAANSTDCLSWDGLPAMRSAEVRTAASVLISDYTKVESKTCDYTEEGEFQVQFKEIPERISQLKMSRASIQNRHKLQPWLLHFAPSCLLMCLGEWRRMAQVFGPVHQRGRRGWSS